MAPLPLTTFSYYDNRVRALNGHPVSEAQIDDWVAEAEHGYDVEALRRGRPRRGDQPARTISVRLTDDEIDGIDRYADKNGGTRSTVIRDALRAFIS